MTTISSPTVSVHNISTGLSMTEDEEKILDWKVYNLGEYLSTRLKAGSFDGDYLNFWNLYNKHYHQQKRGWKSATPDAIRELDNITMSSG
ncbi:MAG: hypothetical protein EOP45_19455 [Sphingobacteriaceae bacterium]|nr:MAG: hypothetical protein EOP45_19455 [Sphingobacteriaceae bacterium]